MTVQILEFDKQKHHAGLRKFTIALQDFERQLDPRLPSGVEIVDDCVERMFFRCRHSDGMILVAEVAGEMVGYALLLTKVTSDEIEDGDIEYGLIPDLVIAGEHQGRGYGTTLLQAAESYARKHGVRWLRIGALARNAAANKLYAQLGFDEIYIEREKDLGRD